MGILSKAAIAQVREIVREEVRQELKRTISPELLESAAISIRNTEKIYDFVIAAEDERKQLETTIEIQQAAIEKLQTDLESLMQSIAELAMVPKS